MTDPHWTGVIFADGRTSRMRRDRAAHRLSVGFASMKVLLFGMIAEKAGAAEVEVSATSTAAARRSLEERIEGLALLSYAVAVDRRIIKGDVRLTGSEEIALLPAFAGG